MLLCDVYCEASRIALLSCSVMTLNIDLSGNILFLYWTIFHEIVTAVIAGVSLGFVRLHPCPSVELMNNVLQVVPIIEPREEGGGL